MTLVVCVSKRLWTGPLSGEVRLADNLGDREVHLNPGQGNIDFTALFQRLELSGYQQHYMMAFGSLEDKLAGREYFAACWPKS